MLNYLEDNRKKELIDLLCKNYQINSSILEELYFYINKKQKVFVSDYELLGIAKVYRTINLGLYFGKFHKERFRITKQGLEIVKPKKNVLLLKKEALSSFLYGEDLLKEDFENSEKVNLNIFLPVKYEEEYLGSVLFNGKFFKNFLSKEKKIEFNKIF